jgi:hypothetical protein
MDAHLRGGDKRIVRAPGPGGATQARTSQPNRTATTDDEDLSDKRGDGGYADSTIDNGRQPRK